MLSERQSESKWTQTIAFGKYFFVSYFKYTHSNIDNTTMLFIYFLLAIIIIFICFVFNFFLSFVLLSCLGCAIAREYFMHPRLHSEFVCTMFHLERAGCLYSNIMKESRNKKQNKKREKNCNENPEFKTLRGSDKTKRKKKLWRTKYKWKEKYSTHCERNALIVNEIRY